MASVCGAFPTSRSERSGNLRRLILDYVLPLLPNLKRISKIQRITAPNAGFVAIGHVPNHTSPYRFIASFDDEKWHKCGTQPCHDGMPGVVQASHKCDWREA
jgi:hypothetical protein